MVWFRIDDGFATSRKVLSIPKSRRALAVGVWTLAGAWCAKELTDGELPGYALEDIPGAEKVKNDLVSAGLWHETETGFVFHDWADYQPSKEEVLKDRADNAARQQAYRERQKAKREAERNALRDELVTEPKGNASVTAPRPDPTRPDPTSIKESSYSSKELDPLPENEQPRSKPVHVESAKLARIYTSKVKLANFGHVATVVQIALAANYTPEQIRAALTALAKDQRSVTENTLRIEIEGKPGQTRTDEQGITRLADGTPIAGKGWQEF